MYSHKSIDEQRGNGTRLHGDRVTQRSRQLIEGCLHTKSEGTSSPSGTGRANRMFADDRPSGTWIAEMASSEGIFTGGPAVVDTCRRPNLDIASDRPQICDYLIISSLRSRVRRRFRQSNAIVARWPSVAPALNRHHQRRIPSGQSRVCRSQYRQLDTSKNLAIENAF